MRHLWPSSSCKRSVFSKMYKSVRLLCVVEILTRQHISLFANGERQHCGIMNQYNNICIYHHVRLESNERWQ